MSIQPVPKASCRAEFLCEAPNATSVFLVGTFNNWNMRSLPMQRDETGEWSAILNLPPGHYEYKFVLVFHGKTDVRDDGPYGTMSYVGTLFDPATEATV